VTEEPRDFVILVLPPIMWSFLATSTECSAGSNDHFVGVGVVVGVPSLVQFDGRPLGGANFQY
jgi:hypothetical protein